MTSRPLRVQDLLTAIELTTGDRNSAYGEPVENFSDTVAVFRGITGVDLTPRQGALFMVAAKLARLRTSPDLADTYVDAMAYLGIAHECGAHEKACDLFGPDDRDVA